MVCMSACIQPASMLHPSLIPSSWMDPTHSGGATPTHLRPFLSLRLESTALFCRLSRVDLRRPGLPRVFRSWVTRRLTSRHPDRPQDLRFHWISHLEMRLLDDLLLCVGKHGASSVSFSSSKCAGKKSSWKTWPFLSQSCVIQLESTLNAPWAPALEQLDQFGAFGVHASPLELQLPGDEQAILSEY